MKRALLVMAGVMTLGSAHAATFFFGAALTGGQEVPPVNTPAFGSASFTVNDATWAIAGSILVTDMTNSITAYHIHLANFGVNGPVVFNLGSNQVSNTTSGNTRTLTFAGTMTDGAFTRAQQLAAFQSFGAYINIHTNVNPGGEIRGQIKELPVPEPATMAVLGLGAAALLKRRRK